MANFFDKMVVGINKGVSSVKEGSNIIIEKAKLNTQIQDNTKAKNEIYKNMGTLVYNLQSSGAIEIDQIKGMCDEIKRLENEISSLESQIRSLEAGKVQYTAPADGIVCSCGCVNTRDSKFCASCGKPIIAPEPVAAPEPAVTPEPVAAPEPEQYTAPPSEPSEVICTCGTVNRSGAKFCAGCGKRLG